jgi:hypothetical protein
VALIRHRLTAIVSVMTGIPVHRDVAMTGEITLRGRVWPSIGSQRTALIGPQYLALPFRGLAVRANKPRPRHRDFGPPEGPVNDRERWPCR